MTVNGETQIASIEGASVRVGAGCMLSSSICIRAGDSHSIVDEYGARTNPSMPVVPGDHVWVGQNALIGKGVEIADKGIVAMGSVVAKGCVGPGCVLGGNPAKVIRRGVGWDRDRLPVSGLDHGGRIGGVCVWSLFGWYFPKWGYEGLK